MTDTLNPSHPERDAIVTYSSDRTAEISWPAILAGFVVALALQALLTLFGVAWGFATIDPGDEPNPFSGLLMGGGIFWAITSIMSLFAGAWIAAQASNSPYAPTGVVHGACVWSLVTLSVLILGTGAVGQAGLAAYSGARAAASGAVEVAEAGASGLASLPEDQITAEIEQAMERQDMTARDIRAEARQIYRDVISREEQRRLRNQAEGVAADVLRSPADASSDISLGLDRMFGSNAPLSEEDRNELERAIADRFDITEAEAEQIAERWQTRWQEAADRVDTLASEASQQAQEAGEAAAEAASTAFLGAAFVSLLGLIAAAAGGAFGKPDEETMRRRGFHL